MASSAPLAFDRFESVPVSNARRFLEPSPVVLLTTHHAGNDNVMALAWHQVLELSPSLVSCVVSRGSRSFDMLRASGECVLNVPTSDMVDTVAHVGNCSGGTVDKFAQFDLRKGQAAAVDAPILPQCHAHIECRLRDDRAVERYNLFILEVMHISARPSPREPDYLHYEGDGVFTHSGRRVSRRRLFRPEMLGF